MRGHGLWLDVGAATVRVQGDSAPLAMQLRAVYGAYPLVTDGGWADVHVQMQRPFSLRRWVRPQIWLRCDGRFPFEPFPAAGPLPFFEWGCNWMIGRRINDLLLLHAGAVERDGLALVMPATPGSGKSTLTAALSLRGWRLLSDEFGVFDPQAGLFRAMLKPVGLKNRSIDVIRAFSPDARLGPSFPKTHKGMVAHLAPDTAAVDRRHEGARPGAVVLPKWVAGSATRLEPLPQHMAFQALAFNAFNYSLLGAAGFEAVVGLANRCVTWNLVYSDLDDALATLDQAWPSVVARAAECSR
jgi:HprK-related kinase A